MCYFSLYLCYDGVGLFNIVFVLFKYGVVKIVGYEGVVFGEVVDIVDFGCVVEIVVYIVCDL